MRDSGLINIPTCQWEYWAIYFGYVVLCAIAVVYSFIEMKKDIRIREKYKKWLGFKGEVKFDNKRILTITMVAVLSGTITAVVGIGGGVIYIPMLLTLGYPPFVASSTSMLMVMYAATANFISFAIGGHVDIGYAFWLALWTCLGVIFGVTGANKIVKKTGRQSIFIILLAGVLMIAIIISITFNTIDTIDDLNDDVKIFKFRDMCKSKA